MKLDFYILEGLYSNHHIEFHECDVVEHPKTFYPATKFPYAIQRSYIHKNEINKISGYSNNVVILLQPDAARAKKIFLDLHNSKIENLRQSLSREERIVEAIKKFKSVWGDDK